MKLSTRSSTDQPLTAAVPVPVVFTTVEPKVTFVSPLRAKVSKKESVGPAKSAPPTVIVCAS